MYYLTANNGPQAGKRYELRTDRTIMGRHPECHVVIEVGAVSRQHAAVNRKGNDYFLEDLNSRNGTFLNEEPAKIDGQRQLKPGDVVRVCEVSYTFHADVPFKVQNKLGITDGAGLGTLMVDDEAGHPNSTIMSKLDVSTSSRGGVHVAASAEVKLAALVEITQNLGRALNLDEVLPQILKSLFKIFVQADRGFIVLEEPNGLLVPRWVRLRREDSNDSLRISRTIVRHVMESRQAILSADAATDERFELSQSIADFRIRSMMCAPLIDNEGKAFGALQIDTLDQRQRFQPEDLELLVSAASQAAVAINNAQLHESALRQREVDHDMKVARDVQLAFLPTSKPALTGYSFFDYYNPAEQIGGDYFDYIPLQDGREAIVVADVVGHGVAAALLMAKLSAETRSSLLSEPNPAIAMTRLNERLSQLNIQRFVTMILVVIDPATNRVQMVNAGHMSPLHRKADGSIDEPAEKIAGLPLGIMDTVEYEQTEIDLGPGESLTLYTDGINESIDADGKFFTIERLRDHVREKPRSMVELGQLIVDDVKKFLGRAPQNDDMCLVCVGRA
ncbi:Phosphoserine phosphatase RsbP [Anatilimnocola aggregata]|uniref:Phosphoserine phosphatase RsbP n=1 Tax=Anatilimnocola aggregata TaxID=2528021 RepID=A0A517Y8I7_9BACT|nr:SpoIIE family protein phosphatase [Anatilimnocola aggregata]QDU26511.1 Phosphoserine phosphatase RsbP [Anatilimnocola aggregata]